MDIQSKLRDIGAITVLNLQNNNFGIEADNNLILLSNGFTLNEKIEIDTYNDFTNFDKPCIVINPYFYYINKYYIIGLLNTKYVYTLLKTYITNNKGKLPIIHLSNIIVPFANEKEQQIIERVYKLVYYTDITTKEHLFFKRLLDVLFMQLKDRTNFKRNDVDLFSDLIEIGDISPKGTKSSIKHIINYMEWMYLKYSSPNHNLGDSLLKCLNIKSVQLRDREV